MIKKEIIKKWLFLFLIYLPFSINAQESKLKFTELNIGIDGRNGYYKILIPSTSKYSNKNYQQSSTGFSAKIQSSFFGDYILKEKQKKFKYGDIFSGEIGLGYFKSDSTGSTLRFNYRFDLGVAFTQIINPNNEFGLTYCYLRFTNDGIVPNGSGSSITVRYRYKNLIIEPTLESHRDRAIGWVMGLIDKNNTVTLKGGITLKYFIKENTQVGIRYEEMPINGNKYIAKNQESQSFKSLRIFYGITF